MPKPAASRRSIARLAILALVALGAGGTFAAEPAICGRPYDESDPRAWKAIASRYAADLEAGRERRVYRDLLVDLVSSEVQKDAAIRDRFTKVAVRIEATLGQGCPAFKTDPGSVMSPRRTLFTGEEEIDLDAMCATPEGSAQADEIRYYALVLEELCRRESGGDVLSLRDKIARLEAEWDSFLFDGYPMFPWEAAVNGWCYHRQMSEGPPDDLVVLLHPSPAVTLGTRTFRDADPDLALSLDLVGWVHYRKGEGAMKWWGITVLAGIASDRGLGLGMGAMYGPMRLGVVFYDDDANGRLKSERPSVLLGIDLYKYLGKGYRKYEKTKEKLEEAKEKMIRGEP